MKLIVIKVQVQKSFNMENNVRKFICVDKWQADADYYHANWMIIEAKTRNIAKAKYCKLAETKYIDVLCKITK